MELPSIWLSLFSCAVFICFKLVLRELDEIKARLVVLPSPKPPYPPHCHLRRNLTGKVLRRGDIVYFDSIFKEARQIPNHMRFMATVVVSLEARPGENMLVEFL